MKSLFCILILFVFINTTCHKQEQAKQLIFGSGGGFTGQQTLYILYPNGEVFKYSGIVAKPENATKIKKISQSETKQIFKQFSALKSEDLIFNNPGNIWYMMAYHEGDTIDYETLKQTIWGGEKPVPEKVKTLYENFMVKMK